jgi:hypothetical protein
MDEKITLTFTDEGTAPPKYRLGFYPRGFWKRFADSYGALAWSKEDGDRATVVAENYSYLLDLLVQARLYYIGAKSVEGQCQPE